MALPNKLIADTSIWVDYLRGKPEVLALADVEEIYLPAMVLAEIQVGWLHAHGLPHRQMRRFDELRSVLFFLPIAGPTIAHYIEIRRQLEIANSIIPENDLWIAATALEHDLPLLTNDAHFLRVAHLQVIESLRP